MYLKTSSLEELQVWFKKKIKIFLCRNSKVQIKISKSYFKKMDLQPWSRWVHSPDNIWESPISKLNIVYAASPWIFFDVILI